MKLLVLLLLTLGAAYRLVLDIVHDKLLAGPEEKICDRVIKYVEKKL